MHKKAGFLFGMLKIHSRASGFTIVELLVVIVVIGILAAITIVSYTGISSRAIVSSLQSDLDNSSRLLKMYQVEHSSYPTSFDANNCPLGTTAPSPDTKYCIKPNSGNTYTYKTSATNSNIFCLTSTKGTQSYNISPDTQPLAGPCPVLSLDAGNKTSYSGSGTVWNDLSGFDNNGVLNGGVSYSPVNGGVMSFDGVSGYADAGNNSSLNINGALTIGIWMRINALPTLSETNMVEKNGYSQYRVGLTTGGFLHTTIQATDGTNTTWLNDYGGNFYPSLNMFYYITYVFDPINGKISLYANGNLYNFMATSYTQIITSSNNLIIGKFPGYSFFNGVISNVKIYNRALSAPDIQQNFNAFRGRYGL